MLARRELWVPHVRKSKAYTNIDLRTTSSYHICNLFITVYNLQVKYVVSIDFVIPMLMLLSYCFHRVPDEYILPDSFFARCGKPQLTAC